MIVLDDLQWADRSSLALLDFLGRSLQAAPVMIIGTYRHDEVADDPRELFVGLSTRAEHIPLAGLADTDVERLVAGLAGPEVGAGWAAEIHRRTGGHPFFVRELATALDQQAAGSPFSLPVGPRRRPRRACATLCGGGRPRRLPNGRCAGRSRPPPRTARPPRSVRPRGTCCGYGALSRARG